MPSVVVVYRVLGSAPTAFLPQARRLSSDVCLLATHALLILIALSAADEDNQKQNKLFFSCNEKRTDEVASAGRTALESPVEPLS